MKRKVNHLREDEIVMSVLDAMTILGMAKFGLEHLTDDFEDERSCELMRREIDVCNELDQLV
jgi:hypothetical protein